MTPDVNRTLEFSSITLTVDHSDEDNPPPHLPAIIGPPKQIACFSVTPTGVEFNTTSLRYVVAPPVGANLGKGCYSFMRRYKDVVHWPQRLDNVLFACLHADAKEYLLQADVVIRRGVLVKLMLGTKIELNVSFIDGVLYIEEYQSKPRLKYYPQFYPGYSFESLCTTSGTTSDLASEQLDPDTQWLSTISRKLGDLNIVVAGKVDCIKGKYTGQPDTFIELKLKKIVDGSKESTASAWYKKSYLQAHLLGVSELFVGYHSNNILRRTGSLYVADIPSKIGRTDQPWNPQIELDRGYTALTAIKKHFSVQLSQSAEVNSLSDDKVWRVEVQDTETKVRELTREEICDFAQAPSDLEKRIGIVPFRVIEELRRLSNLKEI